MNFVCDGLQDFACGVSSNCGGPLGSIPIGRSSWTRMRFMILPRFHPDFENRETQLLGQSLLQTSKHLGWTTRESMEPTQSNKHEAHPLDAKSRDDIPLLLIDLPGGLHEQRGADRAVRPSGRTHYSHPGIVNRFKKSGCRRSKAGANAPLVAGCCLANMRWPSFLYWRACHGAAV